MAIFYNPRIVTDGLVLALDAGNTKSYPGSGTTWTDLSGRGNTGTLTNGPTYSSANGGAIVFDGSNDGVQLPHNSYWILTPTSSFSICSWFYAEPTTQNGSMIFSHQKCNAPTIQIIVEGTTSLRCRLAGSVDDNFATYTANVTGQWNYVVYTFDGAGNMKLYLNSSLVATQISTATWGAYSPGYSEVWLGRRYPCGATNELTGKISQFSYCNRALTAAEVSQNYNSLKSRFIIPITYEQLTYTASGNLTVTGNGTNTVNIFKTSGGNGWDIQAYSTTPFTAPCTIEFNKQAESSDNGISYAMIGWNADPTTNASYSSIDYASYPYSTNNYQVYHNGSLVQNGGTWNTSNKFYIVYGTDGFIRHYNGSTLLYSVNYGTGNTVYVDSSFYSPNATFGGFSNIRVIRSAWDGVNYV